MKKEKYNKKDVKNYLIMLGLLSVATLFVFPIVTPIFLICFIIWYFRYRKL